jgi:uncharacterized protein with ParB-like and HNH nuclease domain
MKASETMLQSIIEGVKQYLVPLFQRSYSWQEKQWKALWENLVELTEAERPRNHFLGSIVTMQTASVPEGIPKYLLIDGQQRLTTIFILLALLRDKARESGEAELADEINDTLLVNRYKKPDDYYRLLPTQADRETFKRVIRSEGDHGQGSIGAAYAFFSRKLKQNRIDAHQLKRVITERLAIVSIVLDADDNPYLVFECLNAKGLPLTQSDLIRNLFFLKIHSDEHDRMYALYWQPMQERLGEDLTEFIRHYLMKSGLFVRQDDVYFTLKERVNRENARDMLADLARFASHYERLVKPGLEDRPELRDALVRLNRLEVTTAYPFLLNCYDDYSQGNLSADELASILAALENFVIRRFVCNVPTHGLNKIFPPLYGQARKVDGTALPDGVKAVLQSRGYPKDAEFRSRLVETKLYGGGDRRTKTMLILESIEAHFQHKEAVDFGKLTIEHVMPQTLTEEWQHDLGDEWEATHELLLHTLGNLTLSGYNPELSNSSFEQKAEQFRNSHLELNKYFHHLVRWRREEIEARAEGLADIALANWPYFGVRSTQPEEETVAKAAPTNLRFQGRTTAVKSWRDVLEQTLNAIIESEPGSFDEVVKAFPRFIHSDQGRFRDSRKLCNGMFVNVNLSANDIRRFCKQVLDTVAIGPDEWVAETQQIS